MSDSVKDAIAQMAMNDLFGGTPEGQKVKQVYESTGRLDVSENKEIKRGKSEDKSTSYHVVKPLDYKAISSAVSESQIVESLMNDITKEKDQAITEIANIATQEAQQELSKMLRRLR